MDLDPKAQMDLDSTSGSGNTNGANTCVGQMFISKQQYIRVYLKQREKRFVHSSKLAMVMQNTRGM
eukprot:3241081-Pleurochrysis_carterae.AAC.2